MYASPDYFTIYLTKSNLRTFKSRDMELLC